MDLEAPWFNPVDLGLTDARRAWLCRRLMEYEAQGAAYEEVVDSPGAVLGDNRDNAYGRRTIELGALAWLSTHCEPARLREYPFWDRELTITLTNIAYSVLTTCVRCAHSAVRMRVLVVSPGAEAMDVHTDGEGQDFSLIFIPLTMRPRQGQTFFVNRDGFAVRPPSASATYGFYADTPHGGDANMSRGRRVVLECMISRVQDDVIDPSMFTSFDQHPFVWSDDVGDGGCCDLSQSLPPQE